MIFSVGDLGFVWRLCNSVVSFSHPDTDAVRLQHVRERYSHLVFKCCQWNTGTWQPCSLLRSKEGITGTISPTSKVHGGGKECDKVKTPAALVVERINLFSNQWVSSVFLGFGLGLVDTFVKRLFFHSYPSAAICVSCV